MVRPAVLAVVGLAVLALLAGDAGQTRAGSIGICTVDGSITGTFEGYSFTNAHVIYSLTYNADDVISGFYGDPDPISHQRQWKAEVYGVGAVNVTGVGSASLGTGRLSSYSADSLFDVPPSSLQLRFAGKSSGWFEENEYFHVEGGFGPAFLDYDLRSSFGPIGLSFRPPPLPTGTLVTDSGDLNVTGVQENGPLGQFWRAQVDVVPEPPSLVLLGLGGLVAVGYGWRRVRAAAAS
jgi:hypothetical protein